MSATQDQVWQDQLAQVRSSQGSTEAIQLKPSQLKRLLGPRIKGKKPVMIAGAPAIGKSEMVVQSAAEAGAACIILHPVVDEPTDYKGMPWIRVTDESCKAEFIPFNNLEKIMQATKLTCVFLDDLGQAEPSVQAALMQLVLAREVNGKRVSDEVTFVAATNRRTDRAGVQGILEPLKSRFLLVQLRPDLPDWLKWANTPREEGGGGINPYVCMYLGFRPEAFYEHKPTGDMINSPSPRTWTMLARDLDDCGVDKDAQVSVFGGYVGKGVAQEFTAFLRLCDDIVQPDAILANPDAAGIPTEPSVLYATAAALANRVEKNSVGRFVKYVEKLIAAGYSEYAALACSSMIGRKNLLTSTPAWVRASSGPIGQMMIGGG